MANSGIRKSWGLACAVAGLALGATADALPAAVDGVVTVDVPAGTVTYDTAVPATATKLVKTGAGEAMLTAASTATSCLVWMTPSATGVQVMVSAGAGPIARGSAVAPACSHRICVRHAFSSSAVGISPPYQASPSRKVSSGLNTLMFAAGSFVPIFGAAGVPDAPLPLVLGDRVTETV